MRTLKIALMLAMALASAWPGMSRGHGAADASRAAAAAAVHHTR
jgi:hypothetical protein